jgi:hypothetical protein
LGGGIYNDGVLTLADSTISGNPASIFGGTFFFGLLRFAEKNRNYSQALANGLLLT